MARWRELAPRRAAPRQSGLSMRTLSWLGDRGASLLVPVSGLIDTLNEQRGGRCLALVWVLGMCCGATGKMGTQARGYACSQTDELCMSRWPEQHVMVARGDGGFAVHVQVAGPARLRILMASIARAASLAPAILLSYGISYCWWHGHWWRRTFILLRKRRLRAAYVPMSSGR